MSDYNAKKLAEELRKLDEIKEDRDYWKKKAEDLQRQEVVRYQTELKKKNTITIGGYGGIEIPLDEDMKKAISGYIYSEVRKLIEEDKELPSKFMKACLNYRDYFKECFNPLIREIVEDMDFKVKFDLDDY